MSNINELVKEEVLTLFTKMKKFRDVQIVQYKLYKLNPLGTNIENLQRSF